MPVSDDSFLNLERRIDEAFNKTSAQLASIRKDVEALKYDVNKLATLMAQLLQSKGQVS